MKAEIYATIHDRTVESVIKGIKEGRERGFESGGQWHVILPSGKQEIDCLQYYEESKAFADDAKWEEAYKSAIKGLKIAIEHSCAERK